MTGSSKRIGPALLLAAALLSGGCGSGQEATAAIPRPDLSALPADVRERLEERRSTADRLAETPDATDVERVAAHAELGHLYRAWGLDDAARACFARAADLAPGDFRWAYHLGRIDRGRDARTEAETEFRRVLELQPDYLPARIWLGEMALEIGDADAARTWFDRALEQQPETAAALAGLGRAAAADGDHETAARRLEAALQLQPGASALRGLLAESYMELARTDAAQRELQRTGRVEVVLPDPLADALVELRGGAAPLLRDGDRALAHGADDQAIALYRQALAIVDDARTRLALGDALFRTGDLTGALVQYVNAGRLLPQDPHPQFMVAEIVALAGEMEQAELQYQAVLALDAQHVGALLGLSRLLRDTERDDEALAGYARVLQLDPTNRAARLERSMLLAATGRPDEALTDLRRSTLDDPRSIELRLALGRLLAETGDDEAALTEVRKALELTEGDAASAASVHAAIGALHARRGDTLEAIQAFEEVLRTEPERSDLRLRLAELQIAAGRYDHAAQSYDAVLVQDPRRIAARLGLSMTMLMAERYARGVSVLEQGLELDPDNAVLANALARLLSTAPDPDVRDGERALSVARGLFEGSRSPQHAETVAMAYAELGNFEEAATWQYALMTQAASGGGSQELIRRLRETLEAYRRGEPVRSPWRRPAP